MARKTRFVLGVGLFLPLAVVAGAQTSGDAAVLRTAAAFLRDSLPRQAIVLDNRMFRSRPSITVSEADDVARALNGARGRFADVIQCAANAGSSRKVCTAFEKKTVIAFARPVVHPASAEVEVYWVYVASEQLVGRTAKLTLLPRAGGKWQVLSMRETGHS